MEFLASDAMNGRGSGTRDEWIAVTYVAAQLRRFGLEPLGDNGGFVQMIEIERPELGAPPVLTVADRRFTHGKQLSVVSMPLPKLAGSLTRYTKGTPAPKGAVMLVGEPMTQEIGADVAAASIVLTNPDGCGPGAKAARDRLPRPAARTLGVPAATPRPACVALDAETYDLVAKAADGTSVTLESDVKSVQKTNTWNAVGRVMGSDPKLSQEVILLGAHIDHIGARANAPAGTDAINNGADDDASGSIAVLEIAEAIMRGPRPKRTIVFAWFGSEESGGAGSRYFADKPVVPLDHIFGDARASVLADDDRAPLARLQILGHQQDAPGKHIGPHVERHFIAIPLLCVVDLARSRIERQERLLKPSQDLFRQVLAIRFGRFDELVGRNWPATKFPRPCFVGQFRRDLMQEKPLAHMF